MQDFETLLAKVTNHYVNTAHFLERAEKCIYCARGHIPYKMKRQTIHHFADSGKIVVCDAASIKSGS